MQCTGCLDSIHSLGTLGNLHKTATSPGLNFLKSMQACLQVCITCYAYAAYQPRNKIDSMLMQLSFEEEEEGCREAHHTR